MLRLLPWESSPLHVADLVRFDPTNPYDQVIPSSDSNPIQGWRDFSAVRVVHISRLL